MLKLWKFFFVGIRSPPRARNRDMMEKAPIEMKEKSKEKEGNVGKEVN